MKKLIIFPSRQRAEKLLVTYKSFFEGLPDVYEIVALVREEEVGVYQKVLKDTQIEISYMPNNYSIADKRNTALKIATSLGYEKVFIVDDDVKLYLRRESDPAHFENIKENYTAVYQVLNKLESVCTLDTPIVGLVNRAMAQEKVGFDWIVNEPIIRLCCYNVEHFERENIRPNELGVKFMSDRYAQLSVIEKGYYTLSYNNAVVDDSGTGALGGCAVTRSAEEQTKAAKAMWERFKDYCEPRIKETGRWTEKRVDLTIRWKRDIPRGMARISDKDALRVSRGARLTEEGIVDV